MTNLLLEFVSPHRYKSANQPPSPNVKLDYLYRDAGNNKLWGEAIFTNNHHLTLCQTAKFINAAFIQDRWFDPDLCGIERFRFEEHDSDLDHDWHEINAISLTEATATMEIDIADFLFNAIKAHTGWVEFDCQETEITIER